MPHLLASSSGVIDEESAELDSFDGENLVTSDIDMAEEILNSTQVNILSSATSPAANPAPNEQKSSESSRSFYFKKCEKEKTNVNHEQWHDKLSQSINSFIITQAQNDKEFFKKLFDEKSSLESGDDDTMVIKIRNSGELFFTEIDLERSDLALKKLSQIIQEVFELSKDISFVMTKRRDFSFEMTNTLKD